MAAIMFSHEAFPAYRLVLASQKHFIFLLGGALLLLKNRNTFGIKSYRLSALCLQLKGSTKTAI